MINGAHFLLHSKDADADRAFIRDALGFKSVDVGHGWLIFGLPPSEMAVHPADSDFTQRHGDQTMLGVVLYLMCDDVAGEVTALAAKGVRCSTIEDAGWGIKTTIRLPSGGDIGLYQPKHATALDLG
jgi:Glyoxalase/Bleomycin resistance protein/Dioxygenase superfamily